MIIAQLLCGTGRRGGRTDGRLAARLAELGDCSEEVGRRTRRRDYRFYTYNYTCLGHFHLC